MRKRAQVPMMLLASALFLAGSTALAQPDRAAAVPRPDLAPAPASAAARVLTLDEAIRTARERQPSLAQARASATAAAAREREALSPLLPQVSGSASYSRSTFNSAPRPGITSAASASGNSWNTQNYYSFGATASELVYDFGQTSGRWRAAGASAEAGKASERAAVLDAVLAVRTSYFSARAARDLVGVARDNLTNLDAHLRQIQGFVAAGTRPEIDLAQARTDRANGLVQLINAENGYATAKAQLNQAMGVEGPTDYEVASETLPPVEKEDQGIDPLLEEALHDRPDLAALDQQVRAQELTLSATKGGYGPSLGVSTGITDAGTALDSTAWNWNAAVTLTWDLFQGGLTRSQVEEARANLDGLRAQRDQLRQKVRLDLEQARLAVRAAKSALDAAGEALVNARERLRLAEGRYKAGAGSVIELGDAQVALTTAAAQKVQAEYNLASARAQLLRALGREA
jgi:outer membrane protein